MKVPSLRISPLLPKIGPPARRSPLTMRVSPEKVNKVTQPLFPFGVTNDLPARPIVSVVLMRFVKSGQQQRSGNSKKIK